MKRAIYILVFCVIAFVGMVGQRWYAYVTNTDSPLDEVGIDLNSRMPGPLNAWGCAKLKETFGNKTLAPYGCQDETSGRWK